MESHRTIKMIWNQWNAQTKEQTNRLYSTLHKLFSNDEQITQEYFGLNSLFLSGGAQNQGGNEYSDFMGLFQTALQMGQQLQRLMLERVLFLRNETRLNYHGNHFGISQKDVLELHNAIVNDREAVL